MYLVWLLVGCINCIYCPIVPGFIIRFSMSINRDCYNIVNIINGWDFLHSAPHNCKISPLQDVSQACILLPLLLGSPASTAPLCCGWGTL